MDLLIKIPLFGGLVLVGAALLYLAIRIATRAYFKSRREYDEEKKNG